jgi:hypothetical protein
MLVGVIFLFIPGSFLQSGRSIKLNSNLHIVLVLLTLILPKCLCKVLGQAFVLLGCYAA